MQIFYRHKKKKKKKIITLFAFTHSFYEYPFQNTMYFFMWTMQSSGAGGEVAQSIKTYGRCSLYLLSSWNERKTSSLLAASQEAADTTTGEPTFAAVQRPLHYEWGERAMACGRRSPGTSSVKLCGRLRVCVITFQPCEHYFFTTANALCRLDLHLDDSGWHPIAIEARPHPEVM